MSPLGVKTNQRPRMWAVASATPLWGWSALPRWVTCWEHFEKLFIIHVSSQIPDFLVSFYFLPSVWLFLLVEMKSCLDHA